MTYDEVAEAVIADYPEVYRSKMFGMVCLKLPTGKVFAGDFHGSMTFKLGIDRIASAGLTEFEPMPGRLMKGWAISPSDQSDKWLDLAKQAHDYTVEATK